MAAYTGPEAGLVEIGSDTPPPLDHLQVNFIDDEENNLADIGLSSLSIDSPTSSKNIKPAVVGNVYSFANTDIRCLSQKTTHTSRNSGANDDEHSVEDDRKPETSSQTKRLIKTLTRQDDIRLHQSATLPVQSPVAGISNWSHARSFAYGLSTSLYEKHPIDGRHAGDPLADCFGLVVRANNAIMSLADGVNWGPAARLAATCAVHGSLAYLNDALYNDGCHTTIDLFVALLR